MYGMEWINKELKIPKASFVCNTARFDTFIVAKTVSRRPILAFKGILPFALSWSIREPLLKALYDLINHINNIQTSTPIDNPSVISGIIAE